MTKKSKTRAHSNLSLASNKSRKKKSLESPDNRKGSITKPRLVEDDS